jgi:hypothetical protein
MRFVTAEQIAILARYFQQQSGVAVSLVRAAAPRP